MKATLCVSALALAGGLSAAAQAATVTLDSGTIDLTLDAFPFDSEDGPPPSPATASYNVGLGTQTRTLSAFGGTAEVTYDLATTSEGTVFEARSLNETGFPETGGGGGTTTFQITFTLSEALYYRFESEVNGYPTGFIALLDSEEASANYDQLGEFGGTFPTIDDEESGFPIAFGKFVSVGLLEAGTHTFSVTAFSTLSRSFIPLNSDGWAKVTLGEEPFLIPTPAAALLGLAMLAGLPLRRRR